MDKTSGTNTTSGALTGLKIVEIAGLGPTPFAAMTLADMGAEVIRIERPGNKHLLGLKYDILNRGRGFVHLDLKDEGDLIKVKQLIDQADGLIEGMRPGVMERLGLGPDAFNQSNPRLVYGRMTGWGQSGPLAQAAGHDINYISLSGALHAIGEAEKPAVPLNLLGDFGGGGMYLAFGMVCALFEASRSGHGQVVDAAIVDGTAHLMAMIYAMKGAGYWSDTRGQNLLDGGAHFYGVYECSDGKFLSVGAIEAKFYQELLDRIGLGAEDLPPQLAPAKWPELKARLAEVFLTRTRDEWCEVLEGTDACVAPVLSLEEAEHHPHHVARGVFETVDGVKQPAPAPRFSRTPGRIKPNPQTKPEDIDELLDDWASQIPVSPVIV